MEGLGGGASRGLAFLAAYTMLLAVITALRPTGVGVWGYLWRAAWTCRRRCRWAVWSCRRCRQFRGESGRGRGTCDNGSGTRPTALTSTRRCVDRRRTCGTGVGRRGSWEWMAVWLRTRPFAPPDSVTGSMPYHLDGSLCVVPSPSPSYWFFWMPLSSVCWDCLAITWISLLFFGDGAHGKGADGGTGGGARMLAGRVVGGGGGGGGEPRGRAGEPSLNRKAPAP